MLNDRFGAALSEMEGRSLAVGLAYYTQYIFLFSLSHKAGKELADFTGEARE
jgi:hypothetical protein